MLPDSKPTKPRIAYCNGIWKTLDKSPPTEIRRWVRTMNTGQDPPKDPPAKPELTYNQWLTEARRAGFWFFGMPITEDFPEAARAAFDSAVDPYDWASELGDVHDLRRLSSAPKGKR
jgi:hypothetical protein